MKSWLGVGTRKKCLGEKHEFWYSLEAPQLGAPNEHHENISVHNLPQICTQDIVFVLFLFWFLFNVPVNNFSVMLRRSYLFLGKTSTFGE